MTSIRPRNSSVKKTQPSQQLLQEAQKMEDKLVELKRTMMTEKNRREKEQQEMRGSGSRWKAADKNMPLKKYSEKVIEKKEQRLMATGKLSGTGKLNMSKERIVIAQRPPTGQTAISNNTSMTQRENTHISSLSQSISNTPRKKSQRPSSGRSVSKEENALSISQLSQSILSEKPANKFNPIEFNIKNALKVQKQIDELDIFLKQLKLEQYYSKFNNNGYDELEYILELNTDNLNEMMIPAGHQIKIMKKVDQIRQKRLENPDENSSIQANRQKKVQNIQQTKQHSQGVGTDSQIQQQQSVKKSKPQVVKKTMEIQQDEVPLGEGEFDEKQSHQSFLDALNAFRNAPKSPKQEKKKIKKVRFSIDTIDNEGKSLKYRKRDLSKIDKKQLNQNDERQNNFFTVENNQQSAFSGGLFSYGGNTHWSGDNFPSSQELSTQTQKKEKIPKISCYDCYKVVELEKQIKIDDKGFCSENCFNKYIQSQQVKCSGQGCKKTQQKSDAHFQQGLYYCSKNCLPEPVVISQEVQAKFQSKQQNNNQPEQPDDMIFELFDLSSTYLSTEQLEKKYKNMKNQ